MRTETRTTLIQVMPVGHGGVFDYLQCLRTHWAEQGVRSHALPLSRQLSGERSLADRVADCAGSQPCSMVLHYSGYGYGRRGLCFWLLDELTALRARHHAGLRLVVVFHELFATGEPMWRSAFWLSRPQALIARRLADMADGVWTNTGQHARWLRQTVGPGKPVHVRPVFSNVGEPELVAPMAERSPQAIVFGSPSTRQRAFDGLRSHEALLQRLGVASLVEVGGGGPSSGLPAAIPCRHAGRLEPEELGRLLQGSRFGLLDYPPQFLGKSGVFAAYASHGCVVLNTSAPGPDTDALVAGRDYVALPTLSEADTGIASHQARAARLNHWYAEHRLRHQARDLLALATA